MKVEWKRARDERNAQLYSQYLQGYTTWAVIETYVAPCQMAIMVERITGYDPRNHTGSRA